MAAIVKVDILADVNENMLTSFSGTDLDRQINKVLKDMSNKDLLVGTDTSQTLVAGDKTLNHPTGFRSMVSLTLIDAAGVENDPLIKLPRGHREYRQLRDNDDSNGRTRWFSDFNSQFFLWRPADQAYTTLIEFYKDHALDPDNIEFDDVKFQELMFAGVTFWKATALSRTKAIALWGPIYSAALQIAEDNMPRNPHIARG